MMIIDCSGFMGIFGEIWSSWTTKEALIVFSKAAKVAAAWPNCQLDAKQ